MKSFDVLKKSSALVVAFTFAFSPIPVGFADEPLIDSSVEDSMPVADPFAAEATAEEPVAENPAESENPLSPAADEPVETAPETIGNSYSVVFSGSEDLYNQSFAKLKTGAYKMDVVETRASCAAADSSCQLITRVHTFLEGPDTGFSKIGELRQTFDAAGAMAETWYHADGSVVEDVTPEPTEPEVTPEPEVTQHSYTIVFSGSEELYNRALAKFNEGSHHADVVESRVDCVMPGPGCGLISRVYTFISGDNKLGELHQVPDSQDPTKLNETWKDANDVDVTNIDFVGSEEADEVEAILGGRPFKKSTLILSNGHVETSYLDESGNLVGTQTVSQTSQTQFQITTAVWKSGNGDLVQTVETILHNGSTTLRIKDSLGRTVSITQMQRDLSKTVIEYFYEDAANPQALTSQHVAMYDSTGKQTYDNTYLFKNGQQISSAWVLNGSQKIRILQATANDYSLGYQVSYLYEAISSTRDFPFDNNTTLENVINMAEIKVVTEYFDPAKGHYTQKYYHKEVTGPFKANPTFANRQSAAGFETYIVVDTLDRIPGDGNDILARPQDIQIGNKSYPAWWQMPYYGYLINGTGDSVGIQPMGVLITGETETVFVEFPKTNSFKIDGIEYEMTVSKDGVISLKEVVSPAMKVQAIVMADLIKNFGFTEIELKTMVVEGLVQINVNLQNLNATVTIDPSVQLPEGMKKLLDEPELSQMPTQINYKLAGIPEPTPSCNAETGVCTPTPLTYLIESASFQLDKFSFELRYLEDTAPVTDQSRLLAVKIYEKDPNMNCTMAPCGRLIKEIYYTYDAFNRIIQIFKITLHNFSRTSETDISREYHGNSNIIQHEHMYFNDYLDDSKDTISDSYYDELGNITNEHKYMQTGWTEAIYFYVGSPAGLNRKIMRFNHFTQPAKNTFEEIKYSASGKETYRHLEASNSWTTNYYHYDDNDNLRTESTQFYDFLTGTNEQTEVWYFYINTGSMWVLEHKEITFTSLHSPEKNYSATVNYLADGRVSQKRHITAYGTSVTDYFYTPDNELDREITIYTDWQNPENDTAELIEYNEDGTVKSKSFRNSVEHTVSDYFYMTAPLQGKQITFMWREIAVTTKNANPADQTFITIHYAPTGQPLNKVTNSQKEHSETFYTYLDHGDGTGTLIREETTHELNHPPFTLTETTIEYDPVAGKILKKTVESPFQKTEQRYSYFQNDIRQYLEWEDTSVLNLTTGKFESFERIFYDPSGKVTRKLFDTPAFHKWTEYEYHEICNAGKCTLGGLKREETLYSDHADPLKDSNTIISYEFNGVYPETKVVETVTYREETSYEYIPYGPGPRKVAREMITFTDKLNPMNNKTDNIRYEYSYDGASGKLARVVARSNDQVVDTRYFYQDVYSPYGNRVVYLQEQRTETIDLLDDSKNKVEMTRYNIDGTKEFYRIDMPNFKSAETRYFYNLPFGLLGREETTEIVDANDYTKNIMTTINYGPNGKPDRKTVKTGNGQQITETLYFYNYSGATLERKETSFTDLNDPSKNSTTITRYDDPWNVTETMDSDTLHSDTTYRYSEIRPGLFVLYYIEIRITDNLGNLISFDHTQYTESGKKFIHGHDENGVRSSTHFIYDQYERLQSEWTLLYVQNDPSKNSWFNIDYDLNTGKMIRKVTDSLAESTDTHYFYQMSGRTIYLEREEIVYEDKNIPQNNYRLETTYDPAGNILSRTKCNLTTGLCAPVPSCNPETGVCAA